MRSSTCSDAPESLAGVQAAGICNTLSLADQKKQKRLAKNRGLADCCHLCSFSKHCVSWLDAVLS